MAFEKIFLPSGRQERRGLFWQGVFRQLGFLNQETKPFHNGYADLDSTKFRVQPNYTISLRQLYFQKLMKIQIGKQAKCTKIKPNNCFLRLSCWNNVM